jgi:glutamyl-tRNA reductase
MPRESSDSRRASGRPRVAVIGCNHHSAPVEWRERVAFSADQALDAASQLRVRGIVDEALVLSTCNRSELYTAIAGEPAAGLAALEHFFTSFHGIGGAELDGRLFRRHGMDAARHLFRVASGLDSMLLGEAEILGQVRDAYGRALDHGSTGPVLNRLFQSALEVGKRVRTETELGTHPMSVAFAGVKLAERVFGKLSGRKALIVGAGAVAEQVVEHLRCRGIGQLRVVNRSGDRAADLARRFNAEPLVWESLYDSLAWPDILVSSLGLNEPLLLREHLERAMQERSGRPMFIVDLGVPRNIAPGAAEVYNLFLYNLDDLGEIIEQNKKAREAEIPRAEALVAGQLEKFEKWQLSVEAIAALGLLQHKLDSERRALLEEQQELLARLAPEDRQRVTQLTEQLIERILREPSRRMSETADFSRRLETAAVLKALFGLESDES